MGHPSAFVELKKSVHLLHCGLTSYEESKLLFNQSDHHPLLIQYLRIPIHHPLTLYGLPIWFISHQSRVILSGCRCWLWTSGLIRWVLVVFIPRSSGSLWVGSWNCRRLGPRRLGRPWSCGILGAGFDVLFWIGFSPSRWTDQSALHQTERQWLRQKHIPRVSPSELCWL